MTDNGQKLTVEPLDTKEDAIREVQGYAEMESIDIEHSSSVEEIVERMENNEYGTIG